LIPYWKDKHHSESTKRKIVDNRRSYVGKGNPMYGRKRNNPKGKASLSYKNGIGDYRKRALKHYGIKCNRCPIEDIRILLVHHKDRNRKNNEIDNFEILCRNCHTIEHLKDSKIRINKFDNKQMKLSKYN